MAAKYPEIKKYILEQIDNGKFKEDVMLPSEKEFTELFNVSRMTVRRAFDDLIQDGVLIRKRGSGLFLAKKKMSRSMNQISVSKDEQLHKIFKQLTVKVLEVKVIDDNYIAKEYFNLEQEKIIRVKRIQLGDGQPIVYEKIYLPLKYFTMVKKEECYQSFENVIEKHFLIKQQELSNQIIVEAKVANKKISSLLQIPINSPILQLKIIAKDSSDKIYYYGINSYPGDQFVYCGES